MKIAKGFLEYEEETPKLSEFGTRHPSSSYVFCGKEGGMREQMEEQPEKVKIP